MATDHWWLGTTTDPTVAANWSTAGSGGAPGVSVPGTGDEVEFDGNGNNPCTFVGNMTFLNFVVVAGYTAKLNLATFNLTLDSGGSLTLDGGGEFDCGTGSHSITAGTLDNKDQTLFTRGTSTFTLNGACTMIGAYNKYFYSLTFASGSIVTIDTSSNSTVSFFGTCTINNEVILNRALRAYQTGRFVLNSGANFSGSYGLSLLDSSSGNGLTTLDASVITPEIGVSRAVSGAILVVGTYSGLVKLRAWDTSSTILELSNGTYNFNGGLALENSGSGEVKLDNSVNNPTINVTDLTINRDSGTIVIDDSSTAVAWTITGDVIDQAATGFTWTKGTGTVDLSGTANQACDFMDQDCGQLTINKSAGTVDIEAGNCELGAVTMVDDLTFTNSTMTASADAKSITGNLDFGNAGNDISCGAANWSITTGTLDNKDCGTFTRQTSTFTLNGVCTMIGIHSNTFNNLTLATSSTVTIDVTTSARIIARGTCTINGAVVLNSVLTVGVDGDFVINEGASFSGSQNLYCQNSTSGHGVITLHSSVTAPIVWFHKPVSGTVLAAGTYGGLVWIFTTVTVDSLLKLSNGTYNFDGGLELENSSTGTLTLDNSTNVPTINVTDLTIDRNNGTIVIDDSSTAVDWTITGDVIDKAATGFTWTKGTGDITLSGSANQDIDFMGQTIEDIIINKSAGTVTFSGAVTTDSFTGTSTGTGDIDPNGQTITITGNCSWAAAFDFNAGATTMNSCTWIVGGNFTADGQSLLATVGWTLTITGRAIVSGIGTVEYSDASGGTMVLAYQGPAVDGGNNTNWLFVPNYQRSIDIDEIYSPIILSPRQGIK